MVPENKILSHAKVPQGVNRPPSNIYPDLERSIDTLIPTNLNLEALTSITCHSDP